MLDNTLKELAETARSLQGRPVGHAELKQLSSCLDAVAKAATHARHAEQERLIARNAVSWLAAQHRAEAVRLMYALQGTGRASQSDLAWLEKQSFSRTERQWANYVRSKVLS